MEWLASCTLRQFNDYIRTTSMSSQQLRHYRALRRRRKNKQYARDSRARKQTVTRERNHSDFIAKLGYDALEAVLSGIAVDDKG